MPGALGLRGDGVATLSRDMAVRASGVRRLIAAGAFLVKVRQIEGLDRFGSGAVQTPRDLKVGSLKATIMSPSLVSSVRNLASTSLHCARILRASFIGSLHGSLITTQVPRLNTTKLRLSVTCREQKLTSSLAAGAGASADGFCARLGAGTTAVAGAVSAVAEGFLKIEVGWSMEIPRPKPPAINRAIGMATRDESGVLLALVGLSMPNILQMLTIPQD